MTALPAIDLFPKFGPIRYLLAPMAGITDTTFRTLARRQGAQIVVSELVSAEGMVRGGQKTFDLMRYSDEERPVGIQIFGNQIDRMAQAAKLVEESGADFVDINFGCPVKKVVSDGGGSAWLKDPIQLAKLLETIKKAIRIPLTIKIRTGWDDSSINALEVVHIAAESGVSWVAIHGRTRSQGYAGLANWDLIKQVAQASSIPVIGNGDIIDAAQARARIEGGYAHAVMIGRGALKNPWIFAELIGETVNRDFNELINQHFDLAIKRKGKYRAFLSLKKFMAWYASGYPHASDFRRHLFTTQDIDGLRDHCLEYFKSLQGIRREDDGKPFLMGGHG